MSRKRDTNWSKDEITVLLDSIIEITKMRAEDRKRTNSREVFEYAAKKLGENGHSSRAEREKCRTKWKKMKEEFTHAKRAREGDSRFKEAPGIQPFYSRIEEFINGNFDNISPHSTIVRRTSSLTSDRPSAGMRTSARIAATSNGTTSTNTSTVTANTTENNDTSSTIVTRENINTENPLSTRNTPSHTSTPSRQNSRSSSGSTNHNVKQQAPSSSSSTSSSTVNLSTSQHQPQPNAISNDEMCAIYTSELTRDQTSTTLSVGGNDSMVRIPTTEQADISYRVSTGCRQITIFGDHDVDIKFRGDRVTINKIVAGYPVADT